jgi:DNA-binding XRE family transcriptional regulator
MKHKSTIPDQKNLMKKMYQKPKAIKPEHQEFLLKLGMKLQKLRKDETISGLATNVGISRNAYTRMEKGETYYSFLNLMLVLDYHKISAMDFFKQEGEL